MDYIYAELNDDIRDTYYTGYLSGSSDEENIGVVVDIDNQTHKISADLSEATKELLATHGDEIVRVEGRLDEEISRAENAEAELLRSLTEEMQATEEKLSSDLDREVARAQAEEASLSRRLSDFKSETDLLATELTNESEVRLYEDTVLTNKLTAEVQRAEAEESRIETALRAALATAESNLSNRITGEELARVTADNNLNVSIENVNTQLTNKIEGEASERALAIEGVTVQLAAEGDTRRAEDNSIRTLIQEEAAISRSEESKLATQINNAVANLQSEDAKIRASLSEELMARIEADRELSASLSTETANRKAADTAITERLDTAEDNIDALEGRATAAEERLDAEESARKAEDARLAGLIDNNASAITTEATTRSEADDAIRGRLNVIEGEGAGSVKKALQDAKAYVDELFVEQGDRDGGQDSLITANKTAIEKEVSDRDSAISGVVTDYKAADLAINNKIGSVTDGKTVVEMISDTQAAAEGYADNKASAAESTAKGYADDIVATEKAAREAKDSELEGKISGNTAAIGNEVTARENAINSINAKLDVEKVSAAIATAKQEAIADAKTETEKQVKTLADSQVAANATRIEEVASLVATEKERAEGAEADLQGQIATNTAAIQRLTEGTSAEEIDSVNDLINYVNEHGTEVTGIKEDIQDNAAAISSLGGRMDTAEGDIDALKTKDTELNTAIGTKLAIDTFNT